jgi:YD repeat-containing protein
MKTIHGLMGASKGIRLANWTKSRATTRVLHSLVVLSLSVPNLLAPFPVRAREGSPADQAAGDNFADMPASHLVPSDPVEVTRPTFPRREPRAADRSLEPATLHSAGAGREPAASEDIPVSSQTLDPPIPPDEPFIILESHAEHQHPYIQTTYFDTNCPVGQHPTERYGVCAATFTFYNGYTQPIGSFFGGYDLTVGYQDPFWRNYGFTFYTSETDACLAGIFNAVVKCKQQSVHQEQVFKATEQMTLQPHESITLTKTIFWSLDQEITWADSRSLRSFCTDPKECRFGTVVKATNPVGHPVNSYTGGLDYPVEDLSLATPSGPLAFIRSYSSIWLEPTTLGYGWAHNQDVHLTFPDDPGGDYGVVWFKAHSANEYAFLENGDGTYTPASGLLANLTRDPGPPIRYTIVDASQNRYVFDETGKLLSWSDPQDRSLAYTYNASGRLERVTDGISGRYLDLTYNEQGRIALVAGTIPREI